LEDKAKSSYLCSPIRKEKVLRFSSLPSFPFAKRA
jgi:hypothetical protein